jgi:hypothetical protein
MLSSAVSDENFRRRPRGLLHRAPAAGSAGFKRIRRRRTCQRSSTEEVEEPDGSGEECNLSPAASRLNPCILPTHL